MSTEVYGASDDLIEFDGYLSGEVGAYGTDDDEKGVLLIFSDGTLLEAKFGKMDMSIWELRLIKKGSLFDRVETYEEGSSDIYSDIAHFKDGLTFCFSAKNWERVQ